MRTSSKNKVVRFVVKVGKFAELRESKEAPLARISTFTTRTTAGTKKILQQTFIEGGESIAWFISYKLEAKIKLKIPKEGYLMLNEELYNLLIEPVWWERNKLW